LSSGQEDRLSSGQKNQSFARQGALQKDHLSVMITILLSVSRTRSSFVIAEEHQSGWGWRGVRLRVFASSWLTI
jgi:hypothetical protein